MGSMLRAHKAYASSVSCSARSTIKGTRLCPASKFERNDDIPVEASGQGVPKPVTTFTNPPLDGHLISNIEMAGYKSPTSVQKYSSQSLCLAVT